MNKKVMLILAAAVAFSVGAAIAATETCTITAVDGDTVTMKCEKTQLKPEMKVNVKPVEKKVEGC